MVILEIFSKLTLSSGFFFLFLSLSVFHLLAHVFIILYVCMYVCDRLQGVYIFGLSAIDRYIVNGHGLNYWLMDNITWKMVVKSKLWCGGRIIGCFWTVIKFQHIPSNSLEYINCCLFPIFLPFLFKKI